MSDKPINHGREHRWFGGTDAGPSDPHITVVISADVAVGDQIPSDTSTHLVDLNPARVGTSVAWGTNAPEIFGIADAGTGAYGIQVKANLMYVVDLWAEMDITGSPTAGKTGAVGLNGLSQVIGGMSPAPWLLSGSNGIVQASVRGLINFPAAYGTPPATHAVTLSQDSGATTSSFSLSVKVTARHFGDSNF